MWRAACCCWRTWEARITCRRLHAGDDPERLYGDALEVLAAIQVRGQAGAAELAPYDREALARELASDARVVLQAPSAALPTAVASADDRRARSSS